MTADGATAAAPTFAITPTLSEAALASAAALFGAEFFAAASEGSPQQRAQLSEILSRDFNERYGALVGSRRLASVMLVATDAASAGDDDDAARLLGCVGAEQAIVLPAGAGGAGGGARILSRGNAEKRLARELGSLGARERNALRKIPLSDLVATLLGDGAAPRPVLSNLAVAAAARRRGVGAALVRACEAAARAEWDAHEMLLIVEEANTPARRLYEALGYELLWREESRAARMAFPDDGGDVVASEEEEVAKLVMRKEFLEE